MKTPLACVLALDRAAEKATAEFMQLTTERMVSMMRDPVSTIGKLADGQKFAFISSVDEEGYPNTKAMLAPCGRAGIHTFYFSTNTSSMRVAQYRANPKASVYFYDRRFYRGAMLLGEMEVLEDAPHKERFWKKGDTMYYKLGVTDPDYCILKFTAHKGRYYSNFASESFDIAPGEL